MIFLATIFLFIEFPTKIRGTKKPAIEVAN